MPGNTWPPSVDERTTLPALAGPPRSLLIPPQTSRANPYTARRETDARGALTRGLAEYVEDVAEIAMPGGRLLRFNNVFSDWADPEEIQSFPSAVVYTTGEAAYDASRLSPVPDEEQRIPAPDGRYLICASEMTVALNLEVWANDVVERRGFGMVLEDALNPFSGMFGFVLELPHYFQARASFEVQGVTYFDSDADAIKRVRRLAFRVAGQVPVLRLTAFPEAKVSARLVEVSTSVVVESNVS